MSRREAGLKGRGVSHRHLQSHRDVHPGPESSLGVGEVITDVHGAGRRVQSGVDESNFPLEDLAGERLAGGLDLLAKANAVNLILVDLRLDPNVAQVGDLEHRFPLGYVLAFNDILPNHDAADGREDWETVISLPFRQDLDQSGRW